MLTLKYTCDDCGEIVTPEWDECEGDYRCPVCYNEMPDYQAYCERNEK